MTDCLLITGGLGYLGGRIAAHLFQMGFQVRLGSSRREPNVPFELANCEVVQIDLSDDDSLDLACEGVSCILHLAALNAQSCENDPEAALLINGLGTLKLLKAAERKSVAKFVYFSTFHIYGPQQQGAINESSLPRPIHPYSITHRIAEDYVLEADVKGSLSGVVFRLSNAVGSPLNRGVACWMLVVNDLCRQVVLNQRMELHSNRYVQRDFMPISGICSAVVFSVQHTDFDGNIVNLSSGKGLSLQNLAELIAERAEVVLKFKPTIQFLDKDGTKDYPVLRISNLALKKAIFSIESDVSEEIDLLLLNCKKWFE